MSIFKLASSLDIDHHNVAEVEGEIRNVVLRDVSTVRQPLMDQGSDLMATNVNSLVQRVTTASTQEIDRVILELQALRDFLQREGDRVQNEVAAYARLSQSALASTKVIAEGMAQWKPVSRSARHDADFSDAAAT